MFLSKAASFVNFFQLINITFLWLQHAILGRIAGTLVLIKPTSIAYRQRGCSCTRTASGRHSLYSVETGRCEKTLRGQELWSVHVCYLSDTHRRGSETNVVRPWHRRITRPRWHYRRRLAGSNLCTSSDNGGGASDCDETVVDDGGALRLTVDDTRYMNIRPAVARCDCVSY